MPGPISYRDFKKMVKAAGCTIDESGLNHIGRIYYQGCLVSTFSVTHGKHAKGNEVKSFYVRDFQKMLQRAKDNEQA
jgi:hypothetical protein